MTRRKVQQMMAAWGVQVRDEYAERGIRYDQLIHESEKVKNEARDLRLRARELIAAVESSRPHMNRGESDGDGPVSD